jgi:hypothetical protein
MRAARSTASGRGLAGGGAVGQALPENAGRQCPRGTKAATSQSLEEIEPGGGKLPASLAEDSAPGLRIAARALREGQGLLAGPVPWVFSCRSGHLCS